MPYYIALTLVASGTGTIPVAAAQTTTQQTQGSEMPDVVTIQFSIIDRRAGVWRNEQIYTQPVLTTVHIGRAMEMAIEEFAPIVLESECFHRPTAAPNYQRQCLHFDFRCVVLVLPAASGH